MASPPQASRANVICERITGTLRRELPGQLLIINEHHLRRVLTEYLPPCNDARPDRSLGCVAYRPTGVKRLCLRPALPDLTATTGGQTC